MSMFGMEYSLLVGAGLFCIGVGGILTQRHAPGLALAAAVMSLGVVYTAAMMSSRWGDAYGGALGVICVLVCACLSAVVLAAAVVFTSEQRSPDMDSADRAKW